MPPHSFVILSTTDWDAPQFGSRQQIARQLVRRGHRALFVEPPRSLHSFVSDPQGTRRALRRIGRIRSVADGPLVYTPPPVLPVYYNPWTQAINQRLFCRYVRRALAQVGWPADILWTYWPNTGYLATCVQARLSVYHCIDDFTAVDYPLTPPGTIARVEADQCRRVDLILARSEAVAVSKRVFNANVQLLPGGVDTAHFDPDAAPADPRIAALAKPRVGFLGTMDNRLDVELLGDCIRRVPDATFAFVGPVKRHLVDVRTLKALPNVRFFPACPYAAAAGVLAAFDVCIIPYRMSPFTAGVSPVKLYEYLAMGKPVVATALPYLQREQARIRLARTAAEFTASLEDALAHPPSVAERSTFRAIARANSWEGQVDEIEHHLARAWTVKT
jgi:glycosyltransferase involved in cell wall biosynthesis